MLLLNVTEEKHLTFEVQIGGVADYEKMESFFRVVLEGIEYGFRAVIGNNTISVALPPLNKVIGARIKEGDEAEIKLEVIADGHYLTPWTDRAKLSNPLIVEAKIRDNAFVANPTLQTTLTVTDDGATQKAIVHEKKKEEIDQTDDIVNRVVEKLAEKLSLNKEQPEVVVKKPVTKPAKKVTKDIDHLVSETISKITGGKKKAGKFTGMSLNEFKKTLTEKDIYTYMAKAGTKNPKIQKVVYEQAEMAAKGSNPIDILQQVIKIVSKKK